MVLRRSRLASTLVFSAGALVGCGDGGVHAPSPLDAGPPLDAGSPPDAGPPTVVFLDEASGTPVPVTSMLWTDRLDIHMAGLPPNADVTVSARYVGWGASAVLTADENGAVDLASQAPQSGSYAGVDPDGIVWSMTASKDPSDTGQNPYALRVTADVEGVAVAEATLVRYASVGVSCTSVTDSGLVGYYCAPKSGAARGGIVAFGGSEGGLQTGQSLAMYYASLGYPTLGLAYFDAPGLPAELALVPLEYFQTAFTWLTARPEVAPGKLLVNGGSRGGELALLLGASFSEVTAVVAHLPSAYAWGAPSSGGTSEVASWTLGGAPVPFVPYVAGAAKAVKQSDGTWATAYAPEFLASIADATAAELDAATTRVENTHGPVLMFAGEDDQVWQACTLSQPAWARLVATGHATAYGDQLVCYPNAGHNVDAFSVGVPAIAETHATDQGESLALGGTPEGIAHAARDADDKLRVFLAQNL